MQTVSSRFPIVPLPDGGADCHCAADYALDGTWCTPYSTQHSLAARSVPPLPPRVLFLQVRLEDDPPSWCTQASGVIQQVLQVVRIPKCPV